MALTRYKTILDKATNHSVAYWTAQPLTEFVESLIRLMQFRKVNRAELARRLGTSRAYVTKVLRGDENLTVTAMVKLSMAVQGAVHVHVSDRDRAVLWNELVSNDRPQVVRYGPTTAQVETSVPESTVSESIAVAG